ncbi:MAG TPA: alpha-mannosidase, partial [Chryseobacterium sp.]|nr:alpha-mannosidase [Chryseobacterium sp.]
GTDQYVIGSPLFKKATITLENGKKFIIEGENNAERNVYILSGTLNTKPFTRNYITYKEIADGGKLSFVMGDKPETQRGVELKDRPYSVSIENSFKLVY